MSDDVHTRAVGLRLAVAVTAALAPWAADARVRDVTERLDQRLTHAVAKEVSPRFGEDPSPDAPRTFAR